MRPKKTQAGTDTPTGPNSALHANDALLAKAAELIRGADALIISAGAGIGVDSGLPDFRGNDGFWRAYPAFEGLKMGFSEVASPSTFETDPYLAWGFYGHRLNLYRATVPHEGFELLRQWAREMRDGCWVFTSNIDGQFEKAGFDPDFIEECHGSIHRVQCLEDCADELWLADTINPQVDMEACRWHGDLPDCPNCGGLARPNVLMFGDYAWNDRVRERQRARRLEWMSELKAARYRPVVLELGAGVAIPTAREFAAHARRQFDEVGARLIRINPRQALVHGPHDVSLRMGALEALRGIQDCLVRRH